VETIPGAEDAGVALVEHGRIRTVAQTSDRIREADEAQYRVAEGPCVDAVWERRIYRIDDLTREIRWPRFAEAMTGLGVRSIVSFRLFVAGDTLGVLNVFSSEPHAFGTESESVGELFATHAAVALAGSRTEAELEVAMGSRDVIGTAKGILAERHGVTGEQAFRMLVATSQNTNVKLVEVARSLVAAADQAAINRPAGSE
jgi:GAF domain-containing protein